MPLPIGFQELLKDSTRGEVRTVCFDSEWLSVIQEDQYWGCCDLPFQAFTGRLTCETPVKGGLRLGQVKQQSGNVRELLHEVVVQIDKSKEGLHFLPSPGPGPL